MVEPQRMWDERSYRAESVDGEARRLPYTGAAFTHSPGGPLPLAGLLKLLLERAELLP